MVKFYNALPASTKLLIQSFLAVLGSVLAGVATAVYQSYVLSGHVNVALLWNVALATFALLFGKAMHDWVPAHAQALIKSITDEKAQLTDALTRSQAIASAAIATNGKQIQSTAPVPHVVVPVPANLKAEDISGIAAQIAMNLMNMAAQRASQSVASTTPAQPATPVAPAPPAQPSTPPYVDPLRNSAVLPAYSPPGDVASQPTQSVPAAAPVPFTL